MSLPFADSPDKSSIYNDLKVKKLVDLSADDFDAFRARMDAQGVEGLEDEYRRLLLLGLASNKISTSGAIEAKFVSASVTDTNKATLFRPEPGQVWALQGIGAVATGGSGTRTYAAYLYDGTTELNWLSVSSSGGNLTFTGEGEYPDAPFYFTYDLYCRVQSTGTFDSIQYNLAVVRVR